MKCPDCGNRMIFKDYGPGKQFYGCSNFPKCRTTHAAHPDGSPMGWPANKQTRKARLRLHREFDYLWQSGIMSRKEAYKLLMSITGLKQEDCHIGKFTENQCDVTIKKLQEIKKSQKDLYRFTDD